ncbi:hypothetical protein WJU16_08755 [Chitinophaga pollutisoli]|uniref:IrrE N-terminal-like domain-containing protein n=1 Tax=Chitinophaga pollutisoli TaxID=3133966 RepID=A0ABZ2YW85_9BACT
MKVIYKKLGREKAFGLSDYGANTIVIDSRLKGRKHLEEALHESLHVYFPEKSETFITNTARKLANILWRMNYRRVDNSVGI